eukprot:358825-Rhodomonas_salina.2
MLVWCARRVCSRVWCAWRGWSRCARRPARALSACLAYAWVCARVAQADEMCDADLGLSAATVLLQGTGIKGPGPDKGSQC